jgi:hypothetical protein
MIAMLRFALLSLFFALEPQLKILPVDEAVRDPALVATRTKLLAALQKHDASAVLALSESDVKLGAAWKEFNGTFQDLLNEPKAGFDVWAELRQSLSLGGKFRSADTFESNYVALLFEGQPGSGVGSWVYEVVTGDNVAVYARPSSKQKAIWQLSYDVVLVGLVEPNGWASVEYRKGHIGYVKADQLAHPGGIVVTLQRGTQGWKIKALEADAE